jgi:hypothetical protein
MAFREVRLRAHIFLRTQILLLLESDYKAVQAGSTKVLKSLSARTRGGMVIGAARPVSSLRPGLTAPWAAQLMILKFTLLVSGPLGVVTTTLPVVAPLGTTAVM